MNYSQLISKQRTSTFLKKQIIDLRNSNSGFRLVQSNKSTNSNRIKQREQNIKQKFAPLRQSIQNCALYQQHSQATVNSQNTNYYPNSKIQTSVGTKTFDVSSHHDPMITTNHVSIENCSSTNSSDDKTECRSSSYNSSMPCDNTTFQKSRITKNKAIVALNFRPSPATTLVSAKPSLQQTKKEYDYTEDSDDDFEVIETTKISANNRNTIKYSIYSLEKIGMDASICPKSLSSLFYPYIPTQIRIIADEIASINNPYLLPNNYKKVPLKTLRQVYDILKTTDKNYIRQKKKDAKTNKVHWDVHLAIPPMLTVKRINSKIGGGVFLRPEAKAISKGTPLGFYCGRYEFFEITENNNNSYLIDIANEPIKLSREQYSRLFGILAEKNYNPNTEYCLVCNAAVGGNWTKLINDGGPEHANCEIDIFYYQYIDYTENKTVCVDPVLLVRTTKKIEPGMQLLINYGEDYWEHINDKHQTTITPNQFILQRKEKKKK